MVFCGMGSLARPVLRERQRGYSTLQARGEPLKVANGAWKQTLHTDLPARFL